MTHIQTEVPEDEYERLQEVAEQRDISIREALQEATELWLEEQDAIDADDPLFTSVDKVRQKGNRGEQTNVMEEGDIVEEWEGNAESLSVADPEE
jgi:hypothetical protein